VKQGCDQRWSDFNIVLNADQKSSAWRGEYVIEGASQMGGERAIAETAPNFRVRHLCSKHISDLINECSVF
jgi:hypothetical protein